MILNIVKSLVVINIMIFSIVASLLINERIAASEYIQHFEIGETALITRGYYKGCDFHVASYDAKNGEYGGVTGKCVVRARTHEAAMFNENELVHKIVPKGK